MIQQRMLEGHRLAARWGGAEFAHNFVASTPSWLIMLAVIEKQHIGNWSLPFAILGAAVGTWLHSLILKSILAPFSVVRYFTMVLFATSLFAATNAAMKQLDYRSQFGLYTLLSFVLLTAIVMEPVAQWIGIRPALPKSASWIWVSIAIDLALGAIPFGIGMALDKEQYRQALPVFVVVAVLLSFVAGFARGLFLDRLLKINQVGQAVGMSDEGEHPESG